MHPEIEDRRANFKGIQVLQETTNFLVTGTIDDVWINRENELIVIDYKAMSATKAISLENDLC